MSRKEFSGLGKELEKWPSDWRPSMDRVGWVGDWTAVSNGTSGRAGEATDVDGSTESDYANEFSDFVAQLVNTRETIPLLERAGRAVLATKLRKLVGG